MTPSPIPRKERSGEQSVDPCKNTGATQQSGEKDRGRDKARKRRRASGGSSSSGARSRSGSSSPSASGRSGCSSGSRSSSSSSSPGSPRPWRPRDHRRRSGSKPKSPRPDEKESRRRSPAPKPTKVHVARLTRKVTREHIREIFSTFGRVRKIDLRRDRMRAHPSQGHAYVEFENPEEAAKALKHMDGGQIDGQQITATAVLAPWPQPPPRRLSSLRRMLPPSPTWRRVRRSRSRSPWGRSPERRRPRCPRCPRHWSGSSSSSCRRKMEKYSGLIQGRQELRGHGSIARSPWKCS
ncbi:RNA-binding protein with serine-rich domain 1-like [Bos indicus x Bos taurus]|uniref:RNA-binding protein with serine-rich domain 1 n=1 Tax=Bos indicus x Bos taurus TaxID=30522 RepID=A0A4W2IP82_BOBOX|nr:RNA-binding protein with serine-rich domain 1-like [Bos indicus x Bos taurus]